MTVSPTARLEEIRNQLGDDHMFLSCDTADEGSVAVAVGETVILTTAPPVHPY